MENIYKRKKKDSNARFVSAVCTPPADYEKFLAGLSARLIAVPPEKVDEEVGNVFREILGFFDVERSSLLRLLPGKKSWMITHSAGLPGVPPLPVGTELPTALIPWGYKKLAKERRHFSFEKADELPSEAILDKKLYKDFNILSGIHIPIAATMSSEYSISAATTGRRRQWPEEIVPRLRLLGEIIVNALERGRGEMELRERLTEIEKLKLQLEKENVYLREEIKTGQGFEKIIGKSDSLNYVLFRVQQVAPTDTTVLILGETGTGKGLVANAIHEMSPRRDRPMITVNCAALPVNLIESELFGREKGAFTGANARQAGRFDLADRGTIFLDEIGEMPLELQAKLLRVLQEGEYERLGSPRTIKVDTRVIASTSRDLKAEVRNKKFREDLYYRLNVFPLSLPPLFMRADDIPLLVNHFSGKFARKLGKKIDTVPKATMKALQKYRWPGNVRELEHVIERAVITSQGLVLQLADRLEPGIPASASYGLGDLETVEKEHILKVLEETSWKIEGVSGAASILNIHPSTLRFRIKKFGIRRP
jgi:formate hydrogenlyase transcriptional activator